MGTRTGPYIIVNGLNTQKYYNSAGSYTGGGLEVIGTGLGVATLAGVTAAAGMASVGPVLPFDNAWLWRAAGFFLLAAVIAYCLIPRHLIDRSRRLPPSVARTSPPRAARLADAAMPSPVPPSFLDAAIHELRPPLDTIQGLADFLHAPPHDLSPEERVEYTALLLDSSRKVSSYVGQLGDLLRIAHGSLHLNERDIDSAELVEAAIRTCREAAEEADVTIIATLFDGIEIHCDPLRLRETLARLILLAVKQASPGSDLHVGIARSGDGGLSIAIRHAGGLPEGVIGSLMWPDIAGGSIDALGLPIALRMALLHGGAVTAETGRDSGAVLRLSLPPSRIAWAESPAAAAHRAA